MPVYSYKGLNTRGRRVAGVLDAESPRGAGAVLRRWGVFPTDLAEEKREGAGRAAPARSLWERASGKDLALLTRHLATLTGAAVPLAEALATLAEQTHRAGLKRVLSHVCNEVREGRSLADALAAHPSMFSRIYVNMVRAGEASGTLELVLARLADHNESQAKLLQTVRGAMTYPILTLGVATVILVFLLAYVVPQVSRIFAETGQELPFLTVVLLTISALVAKTWWLWCAGGAAAFVFGTRFARTPRGRAALDRWLLRAPWVGAILQKLAMGRFARTLSTLLSSGVPILTALDIVQHTLGNTLLRRALEEATESVRQGESLAAPLKRSVVFPSLLVQMIAVGEKSGELESMLARAADAYEKEVEGQLASLSAVLEPAAVLIMGAVVLFIVLAVLLPIFELNRLVG